MKENSPTKTNVGVSSDEGRYYEIVGGNLWLSEDVRENFVYVIGENIFDSREIAYWCDIQIYNNGVKTIEHYSEHYEVEVVPVSSKRVMLVGLELCYADRT